MTTHRVETWKDGKMVHLAEREYTAAEQEGIAVSTLRRLDEKISREKYHDIVAGDAKLTEFLKPLVYAKAIQAFKLRTIRAGGVVRTAVGVFERFDDLPVTGVSKDDIAYVTSTTGVPLINFREAGVYASDGNGWRSIHNEEIKGA